MAFVIAVIIVVGLTIGWPMLLVLGFILFRLNGTVRDRIGLWLDRI
jgi:hypothetical protein